MSRRRHPPKRYDNDPSDSIPVPAQQQDSMNGHTLVYNSRTLEPVSVSNEVITVKSDYYNPNPVTNRWAAYDLSWMFLKALLKRPVPTLLVGFGVIVAINVAWALASNTILVAAGVIKPVSWNNVDKTDVRQVAAWVGGSIAAPATQTATAVLVSAAKENQPQFQYVTDNTRGNQSEVERQARMVSDRGR